MNILSLKNVNYQYEGTTKQVLKNINFDFKLGSIYVIMGRSGSGKTTLLSLISGLDVATDGEILWNGNNLKKINRDDYRANGIGVIFQGYNLLTNATAIENIMLSIEISKSKEKNKRQLALSILEKIGIESEKADRPVLKLSGGEQQRVGIARALSHNPDIIIADEATGNLDRETEKDIMKILIDLAHNENKCVIVVTHSEAVSKYGDEILTLKLGELSNNKRGNKSSV